jgi:hypothetical protein
MQSHAPSATRRIVATPVAATADQPAPLSTLDRHIQQALQSLRDDVDGLLVSLFAPEEHELEQLEMGVQRIRGCVARYNAADEASKRTAVAERERLGAELQPAKIERTAANARIYRKHSAAIGGERRFLFMCPKAEPSTGVCKHPPVPRAFKPCTRVKVQQHINRFHMPDDPLREYRFDDAFWEDGGDAQRAWERQRF